MLERGRKTALDILRPTVETAAAGFVAGLLGGVSVVLRNHRELVHRSVELHPVLQKAFDLEQRTLGVDPKFWAAVHRIHHQMSDVSLAPFGRIANAVNWMVDNPEGAKGVEIPETYPNLDPFVDRFTLGEVMEIGNLANDFFRQRLGDRYRPPTSYQAKELTALLNPQEPRYLYTQREHTGDYTQEEMQDILGGDPHSPARFPESNGVRSELFHVPKVNGGAAGLYRVHPELLPADLQSEDGRYRQYGKLDIALGFGIATAAVLVVRGKYTPKDFLIAAIQGCAINGIKIGLQLMGGNAVNSLGHAGVLSERRVVEAIQDDEYEIQPNPDGTVATDAEKMSGIGNFISRLTFDEAGRQREHHKDPSKIAYTSKRGLQAWIEAPWGSFVSLVTRTKLLSSIVKPGLGFDLKDGERRPDDPHLAVEIIERIRAEQIAHNRQLPLK